MNREAIHESLRSRLEAESQEEGFSALERVSWLVVRLEEYIARFNGALAIPGWSMEDLKRSDTLRVIEVGAELLDGEIRQAAVPTDVVAAWEDVRLCLGAIQSSADWSRSRTFLVPVLGRSVGKGESEKRNAQKLWDATRALCTKVKAAC